MKKVKLLALLVVIFSTVSLLGCAAKNNQNVNSANINNISQFLTYQDEEEKFSFDYPDFLSLDFKNSQEVRLVSKNGEEDFYLSFVVFDQEAGSLIGDSSLVKTTTRQVAGRQAEHKFFEEPAIDKKSETVLIQDFLPGQNLSILYSAVGDAYQKNQTYFYRILDSLEF